MFQIDVNLSSTPGTRDIPRLAYALLRSPLLAEVYQDHPDIKAAVHNLWLGLPPPLLRKAVYPALMSFKDLDTLVSTTRLLPQRVRLFELGHNLCHHRNATHRSCCCFGTPPANPMGFIRLYFLTFK